MKTPSQSKKPDDFGTKGEGQRGKKLLKQGSTNISSFFAFVNLAANMI